MVSDGSIIGKTLTWQWAIPIPFLAGVQAKARGLVINSRRIRLRFMQFPQERCAEFLPFTSSGELDKREFLFRKCMGNTWFTSFVARDSEEPQNAGGFIGRTFPSSI